MRAAILTAARSSRCSRARAGVLTWVLMGMVLCGARLAAAAQGAEAKKDTTTVVWASRPASTWEEAHPVGNGRLTANAPGRISFQAQLRGERNEAHSFPDAGLIEIRTQPGRTYVLTPDERTP